MYPVGSLIQLDSGEIGQVIAANPKIPMRPVVELLLDTTGHVYPPQFVDLAEHSSVNINAVLSRRMLKDMIDSIEREVMDDEAA